MGCMDLALVHAGVPPLVLGSDPIAFKGKYLYINVPNKTDVADIDTALGVLCLDAAKSRNVDACIMLVQREGNSGITTMRTQIKKYVLRPWLPVIRLTDRFETGC